MEEEIKRLLMRALTADPLSIRVVNLEVFLEEIFNCHFALEGQTIIVTCWKKKTKQKSAQTHPGLLDTTPRAILMHSPAAVFVSKTLCFSGSREANRTGVRLNWLTRSSWKEAWCFFLRNRKASHLQLLGLMWKAQRSLWTQCWKVLTVPASSRAWAHYLGRAAGLGAERSLASDHLCLTLPLARSACGENAPSHQYLERANVRCGG